MMYQLSKRDRRQIRYHERSKSARFYGRLLMPVALIVFGQSLWSDPVLGPKLVEGTQEFSQQVQPLLATYAADTPLDGYFGPVPEQIAEKTQAAEADARDATGDETLDVSYSLPAPATPVNRPVTQ